MKTLSVAPPLALLDERCGSSNLFLRQHSAMDRQLGNVCSFFRLLLDFHRELEPHSHTFNQRAR